MNFGGFSVFFLATTKNRARSLTNMKSFFIFIKIMGGGGRVFSGCKAKYEK